MRKIILLFLMLLIAVTPALAAEIPDISPETEQQIRAMVLQWTDYTEEQLNQATLISKERHPDLPATAYPQYCFLCPAEKEFEALSFYSFTPLPGDMLLFALSPNIGKYKNEDDALAEPEQRKIMLAELENNYPFLCLPDEAGYSTGLPGLTEWLTRQIYVVKSSADHPLAGKMIIITYLPDYHGLYSIEEMPLD